MTDPPKEPKTHKKFDRDRPVRKIDFFLLAEHAMQVHNLARCLAAMGFDALSPPLTRGAVEGFLPEYLKFRSLRRMILDSDTEAGRGLERGAWTEEAAAELDALDARAREELAAVNRWARDLQCRIARSEARGIAVYVCTTTGEWRDLSGGALGPDLVSLGALMWQVSVAESAWRCAKVSGLRSLPLVKP